MDPTFIAESGVGAQDFPNVGLTSSQAFEPFNAYEGQNSELFEDYLPRRARDSAIRPMAFLATWDKPTIDGMDLNDQTFNSVYADLMQNNGNSQIIKSMLENDRTSRIDNFTTFRNAEVVNRIDRFRDVTDPNLRSMEAANILQLAGIEPSKVVSTRSLREAAVSNINRVEEDHESTDAIKIHEQLGRLANGAQATLAERFGFEDYTEDFELLTPAERDRLAQIYYPIDDKNRGTNLQQKVDFGIDALIPINYSYKQMRVIEALFPDMDISGMGPLDAITSARDRIRAMDRDTYLSTLDRARAIIEDRTANFGIGLNEQDISMAMDLWDPIFGDLENMHTEESTKDLINGVIMGLDVIPTLGMGARRGTRMARNLYRNTVAELGALGNRRKMQKIIQQMILESKVNGEDTELFRQLQRSRDDLILEYGTVRSPDSGSRGTVSILDRFDMTQAPNLATDYSRFFFTPAEQEMFKDTILGRSRRNLEEVIADHQIINSDATPIAGGLRVNHVLGSTVQDGFADPVSARAVADAAEAAGDGTYTVTVEARNLATGESRIIPKEFLDLLGRADDAEAARHTIATHDPYTAPRGEPEEFRVLVQEDRYYSPEDTLADEVDAAREGVTGWMAKLVNKSSVYKKYFANASNIAEAQADVVTAALRGMREEYTNLAASSMKRANRAINKMDLEGRDMSVQEILQEVDGDIRAARGVMAVRRWADGMHWVTNRNARRALEADGYLRLTLQTGIGPGQQGVHLGRIVDNIHPEERVLNPTTGRIVAYTEDEVERLKADGYQFVQLRRATREGRESFQHILYHKDLPEARLSALPQEVVTRIPGYMPRIYDANYMVARVVSGTDSRGRFYENGREPVSFHNNVEQANREIALRRAQGEEGDFIPMRTREIRDLDSDYQLLARNVVGDVNFLEDTGRLFTTSRGPLLNRVTEGTFDGTSRGPLKDIMETIEVSEHKIGSEAINQLVRTMTARWEKRYGQYYGVVNAFTGRKEMPIWGAIQPYGDHNIDMQLKGKALADRDHIQLVAGVNRTYTRRAWGRAVMATSDFMVTHFSPEGFFKPLYHLGDKLPKLKNTGPFTAVRRFNFVMSMALNPLRQLLLQANTATLYTSTKYAGEYLITGGFHRDFVALTTYHLIKDLPTFSEDASRWAKELGMSEVEYRGLGEAFDRTGFMQSIDSHSYAVGLHNSVSGAFLDTTSKTGRLLNTGKNLVNFSRRIGFDTGEKANMMSAFLLERNKFIKEGRKWDDANVFPELIGATRSRTFNMGRTGSTALNRGTAGFLFQFLQYNMRVAQSLIPTSLHMQGRLSRLLRANKVDDFYQRTIGKLSDKTFDDQERLRMTLLQTFMWGSGGWGLYNLGDKALTIASEVSGEEITLPEEASNVFREGMVGESMNMAIRMATGSEGKIMISSSVAPFSGVAGNFPAADRLDSNPIVKLWEAITLQNTEAYMGLLGPTAANTRRLWEQSKFAFAIMGMPNILELSDGNIPLPYDAKKSPQLAIDSLLRIMPGYNNWMKGQAAIRIGRMTDNDGALGVQATEAEAYAKMLFGMESVSEREVRDARSWLDAVYKEARPAELKDIQDNARVYYDHMQTLVRRLGQGEIDENQFLNLAYQESGAINDVLGDDYQRARFWDSFQTITRSDLNENKEMKLYDSLSRVIKNGTLPSIPSSITKVEAMEDFEGKEDLLRLMREYQRLYYNG